MPRQVDEDEERHGPHRRCIATGTVRPKEELLRFVVGPDGGVVPDVDGKLPGRGIWLSAARDVVNTAVAKKLFAKAARARVAVPDDMSDRVAALLAQRCLGYLGLARRAGRVVSGYEKVRALLQAKRASVLLEAADGAAGGRGKIAALAGTVPVVSLFSSDELGAVLGRDAAVHVAMEPGPLAERLLREASRLAGFRPGHVDFGGKSRENESKARV